MRYELKRRKNDNWNCVNIYSGNKMVAIESHSITRMVPDYRIDFLLSGINPICGDDRKMLISDAFDKLNEWFESAGWEKEI